MPYKYTQNYPSERKDYPSPSKTTEGNIEDPVKLGKGRKSRYHPTEGNPEDGGKLSPSDAERISSDDFPPYEESPISNESENNVKKAA